MKNNTDAVIRALNDYFAEYGTNRSMEYVYGFMDAVAVVRNLVGTEKEK